MTISHQIKALREQKHITGKDLAQRIGLSQSQMSRLEQGKRRIDTEILIRIAEALDVSPAAFFKDTPQDAPALTPRRQKDLDVSHLHRELGRLIRSERRKRHLTSDDLALKLATTKAYVRAVEEGRRNGMEGDFLPRACRFLGIDPLTIVEMQEGIIRGLKWRMHEQDLQLARQAATPGGGAEAGEGTRVGFEELRFTEGTDATARFELKLARPGHHRLRARIAPRPEETFDHDNERTAVVEVVDQATKVLFVAGAPSNEYRILKNLLRRDRRVELASWLMSADPDYPQEGDVVLKKLPSVARELFEYDVVILMDVDPRGLPAGWGELLERFVGKHRGGLAYVAGEKYTTPFFRSTALGPIHDLLPIEPNQVRAEDEFARGRFHQKEWPLVPTVEAADHPATRISSRPDRNRERWAELTGVYWSFPARKAKPAATVLLRHSDPSLAQRGVGRPLLATQFYEGGRSLYLGFDETWRWRSLNEELYDQFWMQMMRSLTEGRLLGDRRKLVLTDRNDYGLGDVVRISALVQDREYQPSTEESVEVEVRTPEGTTRAVTLERDPSQAGWFRGVYMPATVGVHEVKIEGGTAKSVQVEIPDVEFEDPRLDPVTLRDLAEVTGGSVTLPGDLASYVEIPDRIPDRRRRVVLTDEPRPLWDNALTLGLVVMLLTLEWIGRKWSRLP